MGVPHEKKRLVVGDIIVTGENGYLVIERKGAGDYVASIKDGRRTNQLENMSRQLDHSLLLIEGELNIEIMCNRVNKNIVYSSLVGSFLRHSNSGKQGHIGVIVVDTPYDTALILKFAQDKLSDPKGLTRLPTLVVPHVSDNNIVVKMLMCIPGLGEGTARELLKLEPTLSALALASTERLCEVKGVGKGTAEKVKQYLSMGYQP